MVQEAFINGVSTRKIERLAHAMGIDNISPSWFSDINKELTLQADAFRQRPLEAEYPFLRIDALYDKARQAFPDAIRCLEKGLEDSLAFYAFPEVDKKKISSTNSVERLNREIRRRSRVIGVFPSSEAHVRLIACYLRVRRCHVVGFFAKKKPLPRKL